LTCGTDLAEVRRTAVEEMVTLAEQRLNLEPAEALALVSVAGDLRVGQAFGGMPMTLRLEMPRIPGLHPLAHENEADLLR
jgi:acetamidase/formamidase